MHTLQILTPSGSAYKREKFRTFAELEHLITQVYAEVIEKRGYTYEIFY